MIIRHAEKPEPHRIHGVGPGGGHDRRSLTVDGWVRAGLLVELFAPITGGPVRGLRRPDAIYGAAAHGGHSRRSIQTVAPLAARLGIEVDRRFANGEEQALVRELRDRTGASLVAWHHENIPTIAAELGRVTPKPPESWPSDRFDVVWTFVRSGGGWAFDQVPEQVMAEDAAEPIEPEEAG